MSLLSINDFGDASSNAENNDVTGDQGLSGGAPRSANRPRANVVLIGVMGCGKSALGLRLARLIGYGFMDLDAMIERSAQCSIAEIFARQGEDAFREQEHAALVNLEGIRNHVIAVGGGAVMDPDNWLRIQRLGTVVWLDTPAIEVAHRLLMKPDEIMQRPLLSDAVHAASREERFSLLQEKIAAITAQRRPRYSQADIVFVESYATPDVAAQLLKGTLITEKALLP